MPQLKEKRKSNADPSPEFVKKMTGSSDEEWPELARHWASAQINMPNETSRASVRSMGPREGAILGNPYGMTYPNKTIAINPNTVNTDNSIRNTLVHELTHVGQKPRGLVQFMRDRFTPWHQRPNEIEAVNAEATYPWRERGSDIVLRPEKKRK